MEVKRSDAVESLTVRLRDADRVLRLRLKKELATLAKQEAECVAAASWVHDREIADSILSSLADLRKGETEVIIRNLHSGENEIIRFNQKCSPRENADLFYKKARKGERGEEECRSRVAATTQLLEEIGAVRARIASLLLLTEEECASDPDVADLLNEPLLHGGKASVGGRARAQAGSTPKVPYRHYTIQGFDVWVGRNDTQNDELSTRFVKSWHIWLHVAAHAGSHVVIGRQKNAPWPPADVIEKAAAIAVWFSKAKYTSFAEVHVTEGRFVSKRRKSPPGEVQISQFKTVRVSPVSPQLMFKGMQVDD